MERGCLRTENDYNTIQEVHGERGKGGWCYNQKGWFLVGDWERKV